ncbi:hypothetical protein [Phyllobacterium sp. OV277]|uniref:hypothetical protein n=1 Tax=Phyllobacterium sp. OV277 TaxID=1882772 RepID=UPI000890BEF4|nr:hypothetical protein [Phyllobacterium sp. OV277]SDP09424.1 hypothetical protein SAMN05443582_103383 [Phyllobacterium sp. OV277]
MTSVYVMIELHRRAHDLFNSECPKNDTQDERYDPSETARQRYAEADKAESDSLMNVCRCPATSDRDRKLKAEYLLAFAQRNELTQENYLSALEAETKAGQSIDPIDLSDYTISDLETLKWRLEKIGDHLEEIWPVEPCSVPSTIMRGARDLTPVGKEIERLQNWFFAQENRIPEYMAKLKPNSALDEETRHHFLIKNAVMTGATVEEIAKLAQKLAAEVRS